MAEEENKQEQPQITETAEKLEAVEMAKTAEKTEDAKTSGWRYAGVWLAICLGTA